eukprot:CAMPEP_0119120100 /NCGR_PEP_ID=MMETSP1310-20130426/1294_1 /TAXON_ID=464262 /ORGANISM="Genus nov. species nov., Strain RCC2339" /LENGTH=755 /DNA_ID=CAMNT_0007109565 /DNA_START=65 /DNA_END=2332 /DNA_ORIENTATION=-
MWRGYIVLIALSVGIGVIDAIPIENCIKPTDVLNLRSLNFSMVPTGAGLTLGRKAHPFLTENSPWNGILEDERVNGDPFTYQTSLEGAIVQLVDGFQQRERSPQGGHNPAVAGGFTYSGPEYQLYEDWGIRITTDDPTFHPPQLFASGNGLATEDDDLRTPGDGFNNDEMLGLLLIRAENLQDPRKPDDDGGGGSITIRFDRDVTLGCMTFIDIDELGSNNDGGRVRLYAANNVLVQEYGILAYGENARYDLCPYPTPDNVRRLDIFFEGSGSVSGLDFCDVSDRVAPIGDYVWWDINRDGIQDSWEPPVLGVELTLYATGTQSSQRVRLADITTNSSGHYFAGSVYVTDSSKPYYLTVNIPTSLLDFTTGFTSSDQGSDDGLDSNPLISGEARVDVTEATGARLDIDFGIVPKTQDPSSCRYGVRTWSNRDISLYPLPNFHVQYDGVVYYQFSDRDAIKSFLSAKTLDCNLSPQGSYTLLDGLLQEFIATTFTYAKGAPPSNSATAALADAHQFLTGRNPGGEITEVILALRQYNEYCAPQCDCECACCNTGSSACLSGVAGNGNQAYEFNVEVDLTDPAEAVWIYEVCDPRRKTSSECGLGLRSLKDLSHANIVFDVSCAGVFDNSALQAAVTFENLDASSNCEVQFGDPSCTDLELGLFPFLPQYAVVKCADPFPSNKECVRLKLTLDRSVFPNVGHGPAAGMIKSAKTCQYGCIEGPVCSQEEDCNFEEETNPCNGGHCLAMAFAFKHLLG